MGEGGQGAAELQHRAQAGLLRRGELQAGHLQGRHQFSEPQFRAAFQRASVPAAHLLPLPDQDHEGAQPDASNFNARLPTGIHHPQRELQDKETVTKFMESLRQFERIVNDSGLSGIRRLSTDEIVGTENSPDHREVFLAHRRKVTPPCRTSSFRAREMRVGDNRLCLHTLSDAEDLPARWLPTPVTRSSPPTGATAACHLPPR